MALVKTFPVLFRVAVSGFTMQKRSIRASQSHNLPFLVFPHSAAGRPRVQGPSSNKASNSYPLNEGNRILDQVTTTAAAVAAAVARSPSPPQKEGQEAKNKKAPPPRACFEHSMADNVSLPLPFEAEELIDNQALSFFFSLSARDCETKRNETKRPLQ